MTRRDVRHPDWPLFLVAVAGICLSFACGGEAEMPDGGFAAQQKAESDLLPGPTSGGGSDCESRLLSPDAVAGLRRLEAHPADAQIDPSQALVADPEEIAWFDYAFDESSPPRSTFRARRISARSRARDGSWGSAAGSSRALMGR